MAEYTLPDLDWDYGALEPHISGQINELHHSKHHATYVKGANDAVAKLEEARAKEDHSAILLNEKNLAFNLAGHVNHTIWWKNLSPNGGDKPTGELAAAIADVRFVRQVPCAVPRGRYHRAGVGLGGTGLGHTRQQAADIPGLRPPDELPARHCSAAAARHVGTRLLPAVQERQSRLCQGVLERRELGRCAVTVCGRDLADQGVDIRLTPLPQASGSVFRSRASPSPLSWPYIAAL